MRTIIAFALLATLATLASAAPASASLVGFQTENHKVGCYLDGQGVRCDIKKPKWEAPRPPGCELDWGQGVSVLAAGEKLKRGRFKCKALDAATIKCLNKRNGNGFAVSRSDVRLFS